MPAECSIRVQQDADAASARRGHRAGSAPGLAWAGTTRGESAEPPRTGPSGCIPNRAVDSGRMETRRSAPLGHRQHPTAGVRSAPRWPAGRGARDGSFARPLPERPERSTLPCRARFFAPATSPIGRPGSTRRRRNGPMDAPARPEPEPVTAEAPSWAGPGHRRIHSPPRGPLGAVLPGGEVEELRPRSRRSTAAGSTAAPRRPRRPAPPAPPPPARRVGGIPPWNTPKNSAAATRAPSPATIARGDTGHCRARGPGAALSLHILSVPSIASLLRTSILDHPATAGGVQAGK